MAGYGVRRVGLDAQLEWMKEVDRKLDAIRSGRRMNATDVPPYEFTPVTFENSWGNYGSGYEDVGYGIVGNIVRLRGAAAHGTPSTTGTIFILPTEMWPAAIRYGVGISASNGAGCGIFIQPTGEVQVDAYASGASAGFVSLDLISFDRA